MLCFWNELRRKIGLLMEDPTRKGTHELNLSSRKAEEAGFAIISHSNSLSLSLIVRLLRKCTKKEKNLHFESRSQEKKITYVI